MTPWAILRVLCVIFFECHAHSPSFMLLAFLFYLFHFFILHFFTSWLAPCCPLAVKDGLQGLAGANLKTKKEIRAGISPISF